MFIDKENFESWMKRIMDRFNKLDKTLDSIENQARYFEGEKTFDNEQLCHFLNVSKRTLQRYRSSKLLKFYAIHKKFYYKESDVYDFIGKYFSNNKQDDAPENGGDSNTEGGSGELNGEGAGDEGDVERENNGDDEGTVGCSGGDVENGGDSNPESGSGELNGEGAGDEGDVERQKVE